MTRDHRMPTWIPVTELLPDQGVEVWAYDPSGRPEQFAAFVTQIGWVSVGGDEPVEPTHWRPLPDAPVAP